MNTHSLASSLRVVNYRLLRRFNAAARDEDLTHLQRAMLANLDLEDKLTSAELSRRELVTPQAVNLAINELTRRGLVTRCGDPRDGRRQLLSLTDEGRTLIHAIRDEKNSWLSERIESELTSAEQQQLADAVALLQRVVGA